MTRVKYCHFVSKTYKLYIQ